jgi:hypothetical protein
MEVLVFGNMTVFVSSLRSRSDLNGMLFEGIFQVFVRLTKTLRLSLRALVFGARGLKFGEKYRVEWENLVCSIAPTSGELPESFGQTQYVEGVKNQKGYDSAIVAPDYFAFFEHTLAKEHKLRLNMIRDVVSRHRSRQRRARIDFVFVVPVADKRTFGGEEMKPMKIKGAVESGSPFVRLWQAAFDVRKALTEIADVAVR